MKKALLLAGALVAALAGLSSATAAPERATAPSATPGVTSKNIVIGGTFPLSGPASLYAPIPRGMAAYFSYINSRRSKVDGKRGVYGRQIVWKFYDDQYNPSQTVQLTNRLILQDKVFSIVGSLGTEHNQAIRPLLNSRKIPQVFVSTGASFWGTQRKEFPYTVGWQPDYVSEGKVYGRWITQNAPNAKIAVFYQNDDYGKDYLNGLKQGLGSRQNLIVSEQSYEVTDASYASQIARQRASGADTWVLLTTPTPTVRAIGTARALNFRPSQIVINSVAATDGVMSAAVSSAGAAFVNGAISTGYLKNPTNPKYRKDSAVRQYNQLMTEVRAVRSEPGGHVLLLRVREGIRRRQAALRGGQEPDARVADAGHPGHELGQPVHDQGRRQQDDEERQLPARPDQDRPLQRRFLDRG